MGMFLKKKQANLYVLGEWLVNNQLYLQMNLHCFIYIDVCMHVCVCVFIDICIYVCIYIYEER